jgi:hypothetical protein
MHKLTKTLLHLWISLVSVVAFALGWAFLAHAQKPTPLIVSQAQALAPVQPVLEPIPTLNDYLKNGNFQASAFQNPVVSFPRMRTRGS